MRSGDLLAQAKSHDIDYQTMKFPEAMKTGKVASSPMIFPPFIIIVPHGNDEGKVL